MNDERIVITGLGCITPAGLGVEPLIESCLRGDDYAKEVFNIPNVRSRLAMRVDSAQIKKVIKDDRYLRTPAVTQYTLCSAVTAMQDAKLKVTRSNCERIGIFFLTCNGCINSTEEVYRNILQKGPDSANALLFAESVFNAPVSVLSIMLHITGPVVAFPLGAGGLGAAIWYAISLLKSGVIDYAVVGGADELNSAVYEAYSYLKVLSPSDDYPEGIRPFDLTRNGCVLSEGAGFIVLEKYSPGIMERGARIYGELLSCEMSSDGYKLADNDPSGRGISMSIEKSLKNGGISPSDISFIVSFASGSKSLDVMESRGIEKTLADVPVANIKGVIGESMGAGQILNIISGLKWLETGVIPPIHNLKTPDPSCNLNFIMNEPLSLKSAEFFLSTGCSWGGVYNSTIVKRWQSS